ncbi:MAG: hypothetical protein AAGA53_14930 [Pseudomonadota bacterium]
MLQAKGIFVSVIHCLRVLIPAIVAYCFLPSFASAQVVNGDFGAGGTGWTVTAPADSTIAFGGGQMTATSDNNGGGASTTTATQTFVAGDPGFLSYLLVSYTSTDVADWDWPAFDINGTIFRLSTTGALVASVQNAPGVITNATGAANVANFTTLAAGSNTIGPGVFSVDSIFGPGVAVWDDIDFQEITQSPSAQSVLENFTLTLSGANAPQTATNGPTAMTVTLSVTNGIINLGSPGSVTITGGADGTSTVTFSGTPAQVNTAMDGLVYTPNTAYSGPDTLVFTASGGAVTDTDNIPITVDPGNPSISVTKTADLTVNVPVGQTVTYTYVVTNDGDQFVSNISLADAHGGSGPAPTPSNETLTTDNGTLGDSTDGGTNGVWDVLAPGDEITFTATYVVTQNDIDSSQ